MKLDKAEFDRESKRIIEQASVSAHTLSDEQTRKLIQDKFDRAFKLREALKDANLFENIKV